MIYIFESGRKRKAKEIKCDCCGKSFLKSEHCIKSTKHNFCCKECANNFRKQRITLKCDCCGKLFERAYSKIEKNKSKLHFCCKKCKDEAQKINSGFKEIQPSHYGKGTSACVYQRICFEYHKHKCCVCDEDKVVEVHHYDGNHNNNEITNLVPLCPTHHQYWHSKYRYLIKNKVDEYIKNIISSNK